MLVSPSDLVWGGLWGCQESLGLLWEEAHVITQKAALGPTDN